MSKALSPREEEIVDLCIAGLTNEAIAIRLGLSIGTVNTYWLRIKIKSGGQGRTETVSRVIQERAEDARLKSDSKLRRLYEMLADRDREVIELRAVIDLLHHTFDRIGSTVWATDKHLIIHMISNVEPPTSQNGQHWEVGNSVQDMFRTKDPTNPPVAAHLQALEGKESSVKLENMSLHVVPLKDDDDHVLGCVSMFTSC